MADYIAYAMRFLQVTVGSSRPHISSVSINYAVMAGNVNTILGPNAYSFHSSSVSATLVEIIFFTYSDWSIKSCGAITSSMGHLERIYVYMNWRGQLFIQKIV